MHRVTRRPEFSRLLVRGRGFEVAESRCHFRVFIHELFSPALISWLCEAVPAGFGFELNDGHLAVFLPGHLEDRDELSDCARWRHRSQPAFATRRWRRGRATPSSFPRIGRAAISPRRSPR